MVIDIRFTSFGFTVELSGGAGETEARIWSHWLSHIASEYDPASQEDQGYEIGDCKQN